MGCSLYQTFFIILVLITFCLSILTTFTFIFDNIPNEYDRFSARNLLNGYHNTITCSSNPFKNKYTFSYSLGTEYQYSCPMSLSIIIKLSISCLLCMVVSGLIIYCVIIKKISSMCIIVMLCCILNTMYSLYCEFFFIHEEIEGRHFCETLRTTQWQSPVSSFKCHSYRYTVFSILHTTTIVSLMICSISSSFYIKDYKEQQYLNKKLEKKEKEKEHKFTENEAYQSDALVNFEELTNHKHNIKPGEVDFSQLTYN
ncbi:hypothetical protein EDI_202840 [Entamoeba dispar SAW760]|uniref:Uncharacterized protein n=1 Tax=Entamoeba dispar (strain ATCC PRA-260 / SAW760) TaxID=370354 RepID=B0ETA9_ENTDS|nr:uncharacterized protein EDI_202840 [Entamoeba dispar SAW760]EDR22269.1 hypothetical protein EDI_202840 [Entamoeba dispar SAW760]|eukprot:EDR22269.1 hypothetical protein EDI_202840 [Entamoeba dispar SAW760]